MRRAVINPQKHHAYKRYLAFNKDYPNIKAEYKKFDDFYFKNKKNNTEGVYVGLPDFLLHSFYAQQNYFKELSEIQGRNLEPKDMNEKQLKLMRFLNAFNMFLAWRMSLSIYKVDEDIFDEMLKTKIPTDTPSNTFKRLPDFCVYVEFPRFVDMKEINPEIPVEGLKLRGFWAYLDKSVASNGAGGLELRFCSDIVDSEIYPDTLSNVSMIIKDGLTVEESADLVSEQYIGHTKEVAEQLVQSDKLTLYTYLQIILWLCAEEPDITNMVGEPLTTEEVKQPKYSQKKKTGKFIPPSNPRIYHLGSRLGGEIRTFKDTIKQDKTSYKGTSKRPHIRKGHWHGYWTGSKQDKKFIVKWLPATFVNAPN